MVAVSLSASLRIAAQAPVVPILLSLTTGIGNKSEGSGYRFAEFNPNLGMRENGSEGETMQKRKPGNPEVSAIG
jgi:hypothetical protein